MSMTTIIGRGHSGTRAISQTLSESGIFMGSPQNKSSDLIPAEDMYEACRVLGREVKWLGDLEWDWGQLHAMEIPLGFKHLAFTFLQSVLTSAAEHRGWKIPETTLVFPWIARMFPDAKYIYWIRNPRDCILGRHVTDDLHDFCLEYPEAEEIRRRRAISWRYQFDLVKATPKPANWIEVRFEDFVLRQDETLARLEDYLGLKLAKVPVQPEAVARYKQDDETNYFDFLGPAMIEYGYEIPETTLA